MVFWRKNKREPAGGGETSVFEQLRRDQKTRWAGVPVTVCFDYQPYLREPTRRRVNVHSLLEGRSGEHTLVGYCHDEGADKAFRLGSIVSEVLIERTGEPVSPPDFVRRLVRDDLDP